MAQALAAVAAILAELDLIALSRTVAKEAACLLDAERATLFLAENDGEALYAYQEVAAGPARAARLRPGRGLAWICVAQGVPINVPQAYADLRFDPERDRATGTFTRSVLAAPVTGSAGVLGVLEVANKRPGPFDRDDERCVSALCTAIATAVENAKRFSELQSIRCYNESVLQSLSNGVLTLDGACRIVTCNAAALRLIRRRGSDIVGTDAQRVFTDRNAWVLERIRRVAATGLPDVSMDAELRFPGHSLAVNVTILPLIDSRTNAIGTTIVLEDMTAEKRVKAMMSRYMDPCLAAQLIETGNEMLGGRSVRATVLFCDLRDSTGLAETLGAQATVTLLNEIFTMVDECLRAEGGMLDKFIGDAVLAAFGIPVPGADDEDRAVRAALAITNAMQRWNEDRIAAGLREVRLGIGINTDIVVAGNIGSPKRMDYTVIGAGVNLAARLEKACKHTGAAILISGNTAQRLKGHYPMRRVDTIPISIGSDPIDVYEVLAASAARAFRGAKKRAPVMSCIWREHGA